MYVIKLVWTVKAEKIQGQNKESYTRNKDDKQRQYLESILQDHLVLFLKLIRNIYQQVLVSNNEKGRNILWLKLCSSIAAKTLVTFYKVWVATASSWIPNELGNVYHIWRWSSYIAHEVGNIFNFKIKIVSLFIEFVLI